MPSFTLVEITGNRNLYIQEISRRLQVGFFRHRYHINFATEEEIMKLLQLWTPQSHFYFVLVQYESVGMNARIIGTPKVLRKYHWEEMPTLAEPLVFPVDARGEIQPQGIQLPAITPAIQLPTVTPPVVFNKDQSTHAASVHKTVTESLKKLDKRYRKLAISRNIEEVKKFKNKITASNFPDTTKSQREAAKRFIDRMENVFSAKEAGSNFTLEKIIALVWEGIKHGNVDPKVAQEKFIKHLYEIQRGYNLDELGKDKGEQADYVICAGGTINKLVDILNGGLHEDVFIASVSEETVGEKLKALVKNHTLAFVTQSDEQKKLVKEINQLQRPSGDGKTVWEIPDLILNKIKENVKKELYDEFSSNYPPVELDKIFDNSFEYVCLNENDYKKLSEAKTSNRDSLNAWRENSQSSNDPAGSSNNDLSLREDVKNVQKEIDRLMRNSKSLFGINNEKKANKIASALSAALASGIKDVTQDDAVRKALGFHRICGFFGFKIANALKNIDKKLESGKRPSRLK